MAQATVFVDDAVLGTLPLVCAKDGVPTGDRLAISTPIGDGAGLGVAWLLVLAGPLGWIALLIIASLQGARGEVLRVEVPLSEPAYQRRLAAQRNARRGRRIIAVGLMVFAGGSLLTGWSTSAQPTLLVLTAAVAVAGIVVEVTGRMAMRAERIGVSLDGSRRWVTLTGVHPAFAEACRAELVRRRRDLDEPAR